MAAKAAPQISTQSMALALARRLMHDPAHVDFWVIWLLQAMDSIAVDRGPEAEARFTDRLRNIAADLAGRLDSGDWGTGDYQEADYD